MNFLKLTFLTIFSSLILIIYGCGGNNSQSADLVFTNGFVFTVDSLNTEAEAVAVKDGKITEAQKQLILDKQKELQVNSG